MFSFLKNIHNYYQLNKELEGLLISKCNIVVLTGAGVSQESGLSTFRDSNGFWEKHDLNEICRPEGFLKNTELVLKFYNERKNDYFNNADPNLSHKSLFLLEKVFSKNFHVITQNVDDLHERAGNKNIFHIHGMLWIDRCHKCGEKTFNKGDIVFPNECKNCTSLNMIRPHVVFFKEPILYASQIESLINSCHIFISIGTSGSVYPAANYARIVKRNGGVTICINKETPNNSDLFKYFFKGSSSLVNKISRLIMKHKK